MLGKRQARRPSLGSGYLGVLGRLRACRVAPVVAFAGHSKRTEVASRVLAGQVQGRALTWARGCRAPRVASRRGRRAQVRDKEGAWSARGPRDSRGRSSGRPGPGLWLREERGPWLSAAPAPGGFPAVGELVRAAVRPVADDAAVRSPSCPPAPTRRPGGVWGADGNLRGGGPGASGQEPLLQPLSGARLAAGDTGPPAPLSHSCPAAEAGLRSSDPELWASKRKIQIYAFAEYVC